jgi:hypothetical protein
MPKMTEARKRANQKWNEFNMKDRYDRISLLVAKGEKSIIQSHAAARRESLNGFIGRAINETMKRDVEQGDGSAVPQNKRFGKTPPPV